MSKLHSELTLSKLTESRSKEINGGVGLLERVLARFVRQGWEKMKVWGMMKRFGREREMGTKREMEMKMSLGARMIRGIVKKRDLKLKGRYFKRFYEGKISGDMRGKDREKERMMGRLRAIVLKSLLGTIELKLEGCGFRALKWHQDHLDAIKLDRYKQRYTIHMMSVLSKFEESRLKSGFS